MASMLGGAVSCVIWYALGYWKYHTFDNWIGGIWPAIMGAAVSLLLLIVVSKSTSPPPPDVHEIFFED